LGRSQDFAGERAWPRPVAKTIFFLLLLLLTPQGQAKMTDRQQQQEKKIFYNMVTKLCRASAIEE
jgi:hypothetical protein